MVTDNQYKELKRKVENLEKQLSALSMQMSRMIMKNDVKSHSLSFGEMKSRHDKTKYLFNGELLSKRGFVYTFVKSCIAEKNVTTYKEAINLFPDYLQGSLGVIRAAEDASIYSDADKRFYFKDEDLIFFDDKPYVLCAQWDKKNISRIVNRAKELGYQVEEIAIPD